MTIARPPGRYGAPRPWARPVAVASVTIVALVGIVWLMWAAWIQSHPDIAPRLHSFEVVDARTVTGTIEVQREAGVQATCLLKAQASDHSVVGEVSVEIPAGEERSLTRTFEIPTERPATAVMLDGCTSGG